MSVHTQAKRDGWRRDWPMFAGLAVSASLVFASTVVGAPSGDDPAPRPAAQTVAGTGVAPPAAEAPAPDVSATAAATAKPHRKATKAKKAAGTTPKATVAEKPAGATTSAPKTATPNPAATKPDTAMIVTVKGTSGLSRRAGKEVVFAATSHSPATGSLWSISLTGTNSGKPLVGTVRVDVVHNGEVVGHIHSGKFTAGKYKHVIRWPKEAVGQPLVVKATIDVAGKTQTFLFDVRVRAAG